MWNAFSFYLKKPLRRVRSSVDIASQFRLCLYFDLFLRGYALHDSQVKYFAQRCCSAKISTAFVFWFTKMRKFFLHFQRRESQSRINLSTILWPSSRELFLARRNSCVFSFSQYWCLHVHFHECIYTLAMWDKKYIDNEFQKISFKRTRDIVHIQSGGLVHENWLM